MIDLISFKHDTSYVRPKHLVFESKIKRAGDCDENDYKYQPFGFTWFSKGYLLYHGINDKDPGTFYDIMKTPYYIIHEEYFHKHELYVSD